MLRTNVMQKESLIKEYEVLKSRMYLLNMFIAGDEFGDFSFKIRFYMKMQLAAMTKYCKYLRKRMDALDVFIDYKEPQMSEEVARKYVKQYTAEKKAKETKKVIKDGKAKKD